MDYKATLNLPKTDFPMKANLAQAEPKVLARWDEERLYEKLQTARKEAPPFILHDGPPYANGDIHIGHALNKILKDFILRYQSMRGRRAPYVPGWDCHGLPIEFALMKDLKTTKHKVDVVDFRKKARAYAQRFVDTQRQQFKRLGILGDWDHPYLTLHPEYVAAELRALAKIVSKGFVYRARKPVNWCWSCETALAEAEVEYDNLSSPSLYAKFPVLQDGPDKTYLVIWTTTPWTLMGNVAVAVHSDFTYAKRRVSPNEIWITLADLPKAALRDVKSASEAEVIETFPGKKLEGLRYRHPFEFREGKVVLADYVSAEDGTGLVHTAPGFGAEDFLTGKKYGLEMLTPVNSRGQYEGLPAEVEALNGTRVLDANPKVLELLKEKGLLVHAGQFDHPYPHCWRCRHPIIFRATDQWFFNVEHQGFRGQLLKAAEEEVRWIPSVGKERMVGMLKTRPDWCLSRQRLWGVPIPAVNCAACGEGILDARVIENFAKAVEKDPEGSDQWFTEPVTKWLPSDFACACGSKEFNPGTDILDVWFDSGVSHQGVLTTRPELKHPADLYLEGSDQHRGWFQVSLITGTALAGHAPYRSVLTHGFVVDGDGRKMSKSLGNVIAPKQVIESLGADVLRLWVAASDYSEDIRLSKTILDQSAEHYRKIRNTVRFCMANVSDLDAAYHNKPLTDLTGLDRWMAVELGRLSGEITAAYDAYAFNKAVKLSHEFCTTRLSNFYLDVVKDILYTAHPKDPRRVAIQRVLLAIARVLTLALAPILPVTCEEAWAALPFGGSVHLQNWPDAALFPDDEPLRAEWQRLLEFRDQAMKALEKARAAELIGDALEADLEIRVGAEADWAFLEPRREAFASACIVSGLKLTRVTGSSGVEMEVRKADGSKCSRCWMRLATVGSDAEHPALCHRCVDVVRKL